MTSLSLATWIALAIGLQLAIFLAIVLRQNWLDYRSLRNGTAVIDSLAGGDSQAVRNEQKGAAWTGWRAFRVERKIIEDAAQSVCSFHLVAEDGQALPSYLPGQFLTFRLDLPAAGGDTEQVVRCYSLSDGPQPGAYRISVKRVPAPSGSALPPGRVSAYLHDQVTVGSVLHVRAPGGHFHLDRSDAPTVLIAGGIGITPMLSMLNWCSAEQPQREIWLYYGVRHSRELIMSSHLRALAAAHPNFHLQLCCSDPEAADVLPRDYQHRGRVDVALLRGQLPLKPYHFYLCGPTPMMESLVSGLEDWGVADERIHFEAFGPASIRRRPSALTAGRDVQVDAMAADQVVTFARSGRQAVWRPGAGSLLELAEVNGLAVESGCRAGGCGTCQTTIRSGEVSYNEPPDFDPAPGTCLLCVGVPKTSVTLEV
jgi:ferredoxin-NADP reductase